MYEASKVLWFCAAHQIRFDNGECERLHGHNWRVRVTAQAREVDTTGYVVDFARLKQAAWDAVQRFDHGNLNEVAPFTTLNPTAENLARFVHAELARQFNDARVRVHRVEIWETENNRAAYVDEAAWGVG